MCGDTGLKVDGDKEINAVFVSKVFSISFHVN